MTESPLPRKHRFLFIDFFRSAVILLMLEGHVLRTVLTPALQKSALFQLHEFVHGLSAPAFLFGAGLTFVISTKRRWSEFHRWGPPLSRRVRRLLFVFALGLFLHLPYFSFRKIAIDGTEQEVLRLFQFDVLHCIGMGLLVLHALIFFFRTEVRFYGLVLATVVAVCFLTPLIWDIDFLNLRNPFIAQMMNGMHGSPFPLFPYIGFLFAGVVVSWEYLVAYEEKREADFMVRLFVTGSAAIGLGTFFDLLPVKIYPTYNYWFTSPNYFLIRTGALMMLLAMFWYAARKYRSVPRVITVLGIESLFVYVAHLLLLYGSVVNPTLNLQALIGGSFGLPAAILLYAAVLVVMLLVALVWNMLKENRFHAYRIIQLAAAAAFLLLFFTRDF